MINIKIVSIIKVILVKILVKILHLGLGTKAKRFTKTVFLFNTAYSAYISTMCFICSQAIKPIYNDKLNFIYFSSNVN